MKPTNVCQFPDDEKEWTLRTIEFADKLHHGVVKGLSHIEDLSDIIQTW